MTSPNHDHDLETRVHLLERRLRRISAAALAMVLLLVPAGVLGFKAQQQDAEKPLVDDDGTLRVRQIFIHDEQDRTRIRIGSLGERMHGESIGISIHDETGAERFGLGTFPDGRIAMGFDAPRGVGSPMPDRLAMGVTPEGHGYIMFINNETLVPTRIYTDTDGVGVLEFIDWDTTDPEDPTIRGFQRFGVKTHYEPSEPAQRESEGGEGEE